MSKTLNSPSNKRAKRRQLKVKPIYLQKNSQDEIKTSLIKNNDLNGVITQKRKSENEGKETVVTEMKNQMSQDEINTKVSLEKFESSNERSRDVTRYFPAEIRNILSPYDSQIHSPTTLSSGVEQSQLDPKHFRGTLDQL